MTRFSSTNLYRRFPNPISKAMLKGLVAALALQIILLISGVWVSMAAGYSLRLDQLALERELVEDNLTQMYTRTVETTILLLENAAARIAPNPDLFLSRSPQVSRIFASIPSRLEVISRLLLLDSEGNLILDSDPNFIPSISESPNTMYQNSWFFQETKNAPLGSAIIGSPLPYEDEYVFTISSPIYRIARGPDDPPVAVITAFINPLGQKFNLQRPNLERFFQAFMVDQNNLVLSSWPYPNIFHGETLLLCDQGEPIPLRTDFSIFLILEQVESLDWSDWLTINPLLLLYFSLIILGTFVLEAFLIRNLIRLNESNRQALETKDILIREIHHRVRNNLQIMASLIHLQLHTFEDQETTSHPSNQMYKTLETTLLRVQTIAKVHDVLYSSRNMEAMDLKSFIDEHLQLFQDLNVNSIRFSVENCLFDEIFIPLDVAVPLGIILNEMLHNAVSHGFTKKQQELGTLAHSDIDRGKNEIMVNLSCNNQDSPLKITIKDNGQGFDPRSEFAGLGLELIHQLEHQIPGTCKLESTLDEGTIWTIELNM